MRNDLRGYPLSVSIYTGTLTAVGECGERRGGGGGEEGGGRGKANLPARCRTAFVC